MVTDSAVKCHFEVFGSIDASLNIYDGREEASSSYDRGNWNSGDAVFWF